MINIPGINTRQIRLNTPQIRPTQFSLPSVGFMSDYQRSVIRQEYLNKMNERSTMYSLFDPILNIKARNKLISGSWYEGSFIAEAVIGTLHGYVDIARRMYDVRNPSQMLMSMLRFVGDTADMLATLTVKPWMHSHQYGTTIGESYARLTGLDGRGRYNYWFGDFNETIDWLPDNWAVNLVGEIVTNPSVWITLGKAAILKVKTGGVSAVNAKVAATQTLDEATTAVAGKMSKSTMSAFSDMKGSVPEMYRANKFLWQGDRKRFINLMRKYKMDGKLIDGIDDVFIRTMYDTAVNEITGKKFYRFLHALESAELGMLRAIRKVTPISVARRGMTKGWQGLKYAKLNEPIAQTAEAINKYSALDNLDDFSKVSLDELKENLLKAEIDLSAASQAKKGTKQYKKALQNFTEAQKQVAAKEALETKIDKQQIIQSTQETIEKNKVKIITWEEKLNDPTLSARQKNAYATNIKKVTKEIDTLQILKEDSELILEGINSFWKDYKLLKQSMISSEAFGRSKIGQVINAQERQARALELEKLELDLNKTVFQSSKWKTIKNKMNQIEDATKTYDAVMRLVSLANDSPQMANLLINTMNTPGNKQLKEYFLMLAKSHFDVVKKEADNNRKIIEQAIETFKQNNNIAPNAFTMDMMDPKAIQQDVADKFIEQVKEIEIWDKISRTDKEYMQMLDNYDKLYRAMLEGKYTRTVQTREDQFLGGVKNEFRKEILNAISKMDSFVDDGSEVNPMYNVNKLLENVRITGDSRRNAQLYRALKKLDGYMTKYNGKHFVSNAKKYTKIYKEIDTILTNNGLKNRKQSLLNLYSGINDFQKAAKGYTAEEIETLLLAPGREFDFLAPLLSGAKTIPTTLEGSALYELSYYLRKIAIKDGSEGFSQLNNTKRLLKHLANNEYNVDDLMELEKIIEVFERTRIVTRNSAGAYKVSQEIIDMFGDEYAEVFQRTYNGLKQQQKLVKQIEKTYTELIKNPSMTEEAITKELKSLIKSKSLEALDLQILDDFNTQHFFAMSSLSQYKDAYELLGQAGKTDAEVVIENFKRMLSTIEVDGVPVDVDALGIELTPQMIINFYNDVVLEVKERTYTLFSNYMNFKEVATNNLKRLKTLSELKTRKKLTAGQSKEYNALLKDRDYYVNLLRLARQEENIKTQKIIDLFIKKSDLTNIDNRSIDLITAIIIKQEYQPIFDYVKYMHQANYFMGGDLVKVTTDLNTYLSNINKIRVTNKGKYIGIPEGIKKWLVDNDRESYKKFLQSKSTADLELAVRDYTDQVYKDIVNELERLQYMTILDVAQSTPGSSTTVKNTFYRLMYGTRVDDPRTGKEFFNNRFNVPADSRDLQNMAYNPDGTQYTGNIDFATARKVFIDAETTGTQIDSEVFQVAVTIVEPDGSRVYRNFYFRTTNPIPPNIKKGTGHLGDAYEKALAKQGHLGDNEAVQREIANLIDDNTIVIAHNAVFDMSKFGQIFGNELTSSPAIMDSLPLMRLYKAELENRLNENINTIRGLGSIEEIELNILDKKVLLNKKVKELKALEKSKKLYNPVEKEELINKNLQTQKDIRNSLQTLEQQKEQIRKDLPILEQTLERYTSLENTKQQTLLDMLVSDGRKEKLSRELKKEFPDIGVHDHNAVYDTAMLSELMDSMVLVENGKVSTGSLNDLMKLYGVNKVSDINNSTLGVYTKENINLLNKILNGEGAWDDNSLRRKVVLYLERLGGGREGDLRNYGIASSTDDIQVVDSLLNIDTYLEELDTILKGNITKINKQAVYSLSTDLQDEIQNIKYIINKTHSIQNENVEYAARVFRSADELGGTPTFDNPALFSDLDGIDFILDIEDEIYKIERYLDDITRKENAILNALYGDRYAQVVDSDLLNTFKILSAYKDNDNLRNIINILKGNTKDITEYNQRQLSIAFSELFKKDLQNIGIDTKGMTNAEILELYRTEMPDNEMTRFFDFFDDIDEYVDFTEHIYGTLDKKIRFARSDETRELYRAGAGKVNEFFKKLEREYKILIDKHVANGTQPNMGEFTHIYYGLINDPKMSALIKSSTFIAEDGTARILPEFIGMDLTRDIEAYVFKRINKYFDQGQNELRLLMNLDTSNSHELYYLLKENILDPVYYYHSSRVTNASNNQIVQQVDTVFDGLKKLIDGALEDIRTPLKQIKVANKTAPLYNLGAINKHVNDLKDAGKFYDEYLSHAELVLRNEAQVIKLTQESKNSSQALRRVYELLEGLTEDKTTLNTFQNTKSVSQLNRLLDRLSQNLIGDDTVDTTMLSYYFNRNTQSTHQRLTKIEFLESLLSFETNNDTLREYADIIRSLEKWAKEESFDYGVSWIKRSADGTVDLAKADEFMNRIKASVWDYINEMEPVKFKDAMANLYDQNFTKKEILNSQNENLRNVFRISEATHDTYRQMKEFFGDGPEGAKNMFEFLRKNPDEYSLVRFDLDRKTRKGGAVRKIKVNSAQDIMLLEQQMASGTADASRMIGITDNDTFLKLQESLGQTFKFKRNSIPDRIRRQLLMPLKSSMLLNSNFVFSNIFDATLKNLITQEGGVFDSHSVIGSTWQARKMYKVYEEVFNDSHRVLKQILGKEKLTAKEVLSRDWITLYENYLKTSKNYTAEMQWKIETVKQVDMFFNSKASGGRFQEMLFGAIDIGKGRRNTTYENAINSMFYGSEYSPFAWNVKLNSKVEIYSRLGLYLNDIEKGYTKNEALNRVLKTHFNYTDKSREEMYAEFVIPFMSFPIRSFLFWEDAFFKNPRQAKFLSQLITRSWGQDVISQNEYAEYQASRGRLPIGDYSVNLGLTYMDALGAVGSVSQAPIPFSDQFVRKINPVAKQLIEPSDRTLGERVQRMPFISQGVATRNAVVAGTQGESDLTNYLPAMFNSYYRGSFNTRYTQTRYRNAQFRQNYSYTSNIVPNARRAIRWRMTNLDRYKSATF